MAHTSVPRPARWPNRNRKRHEAHQVLHISDLMCLQFISVSLSQLLSLNDSFSCIIRPTDCRLQFRLCAEPLYSPVSMTSCYLAETLLSHCFEIHSKIDIAWLKCIGLCSPLVSQGTWILFEGRNLLLVKVLSAYLSTLDFCTYHMRKTSVTRRLMRCTLCNLCISKAIFDFGISKVC